MAVTPSNSYNPPWIYDQKQLQNTPSRRAGINESTETRYRRDGVELIVAVGTKLNLQRNPTLATAAIFYHRFFMCKSFNEFNRHIVALAALFLAGKVQETPKKCRDIVKASQEHLKDDQIARMGKYPIEEVMAAELVLLRTLKMDLQVELPYQFLFQFAKRNISGVNINTMRQIVQTAHTFINDSLITTIMLEWEPEIVAVALLHMATTIQNVEIADWPNKGSTGRGRDEKWYDLIVDGLTTDMLEAVCHKVLDIYPDGDAGGAASQSNNNCTTPSASVPCTPPSANASPAINNLCGSSSGSSGRLNAMAGGSSAAAAPPPPPARPNPPVMGSLHPSTSMASAHHGQLQAGNELQQQQHAHMAQQQQMVAGGGDAAANPLPMPPNFAAGAGGPNAGANGVLAAQTMATYAVAPRPSVPMGQQAYATPVMGQPVGGAHHSRPPPSHFAGVAPPPPAGYYMPPSAPMYGAPYPPVQAARTYGALPPQPHNARFGRQ